MLIFIFPVGVLLCFQTLRDEHVFVIIYAIMASYFAGVMVRLMLTLTPLVCVAAAIAVSTLLDKYIDPQEPEVPIEERAQTDVGSTNTSTAPANSNKPTTNKVASTVNGIFGLDTRLAVVANTLFLLLIFCLHCTWTTSHAYSSPSVVLASRSASGEQSIIDDFREAYYWLRQNTPQDAVVMSWWDYGYQIAGMADRPTLVDNNTWNNSECPSFHLHSALNLCLPFPFALGVL
jgi:dolichyl-diphosphooligosaccharide--protein glycosyltransferase